ncbi:DUF4315 family protein [Butyrivibrio sp. INlla16]|jgi:hypothetical protein|uniref:DUF4315 family protein n=1 Tax=Butyrivibrio sp. INlla16 TaxID=1520807 RepID=UPI00088B38B2|nr:DUF4315 family protein [Butyrivibrio sp. INlla16]SDB65996.1 protein of unknown function [Butyrivibrio sp. INlla16]
MFERLDRYKAELAKAREKKAEIDARVRALEKKCQEEEKTAVHEMMKAADITPAELQKLIAYTKGNMPGGKSVGEIVNKKDEEEITDENED